MSLIISVEFGIYRNDSQIYSEALEALSEQYYSQRANPGPMQCGGSCFLDSQLLWGTQMEGIYNRDDFSSFAYVWEQYSSDAQYAIDLRASGDSWFWGNIGADQLSQFEIVAIRESYLYPGRPFFIVHEGRR